MFYEVTLESLYNMYIRKIVGLPINNQGKMSPSFKLPFYFINPVLIMDTTPPYH